MEKKIEKKFNFLLNEMNKKHNDIDNKSFGDMDKVIQSKYQDVVNKVKAKITVDCKSQFEKLKVYTEYDKNWNIEGNTNSDNISNEIKIDIDQLKSNRGYEREFKQAKEEYKKCSIDYENLISSLNIHSQVLSDLTVVSNQECLSECKNDIKRKAGISVNGKTENIGNTGQLNENQIRNCIDSCYRYRKYNLLAYNSAIYEKIDQLKKELI